MDEAFINFLYSQSWMRVVSVLVRLNRPCCMRELIDLTGMSPGGMKYLLKGLEDAQIISSQRSKNKKLFSISPDSEMCRFVRNLLDYKIEHQLRLRSSDYSARYENVLFWIDVTIKGLKVAKRNISTAGAS